LDTTSTTSQPKYLLAVDPGLATGVALLDITDTENIFVVNTWECDVEEFYDLAEKVLEDFGEIEVVAERFIITVQTAKLSQAPWSLEMLGILKFLCRKYKHRITLQKPSEKTFAPNDKLRLAGFWHRGGDGHANDALRHALVYIVNQHPNWAKRLIM
jgi:hypothetical protein